MDIVIGIPNPSVPMLRVLLGAFVRVNQIHLRAHPETPDLYKAGIRYQAERGERWQTIPELLDTKLGDCEDLSAYRVAWLRNRGIPADILLSWNDRGPLGLGGRLYHVRVRVGEKIEDPSSLLGMI